MASNEFLNDFFALFHDSKVLVTDDYVNGKISKEEFIIRMKAAEEREANEQRGNNRQDI